MFQIRAALNAYQHENGVLPSCTIRTEDKNELTHSWRAAIIDYFATRNSQYDFKAAWDSAGNHAMSYTANEIYALSGTNMTRVHPVTNFLAFEGFDTAWTGTSRMGFNSKLPSDIILVISGSNLPIMPLEPKDVTVKEMQEYEGPICDYLESDRDVVVLFADSSIWVISKKTPAKLLARFATISGSRELDRDTELRRWLRKVATSSQDQ